jgi:helix-turn-helix protein/putative peptidoglycan binding protein
VIASPQTDKFAAYLRMLKDRSGRGFERLGKQAGVSGSSLHRYCSGSSVPTDYRIVHTFAKVCGASAEELRDLHQLWALADADRDIPTADEQDTPPQEEPVVDEEPRASRVPALLKSRYAAVAVVVLVLLVGGLIWSTSGQSAGSGGPYSDKMLFSQACQASVSMGQHDECVIEVQKLLLAAKGRLTVDGDFGPETLKRVTAFQVLAGLTARGVVDTPTKTALYDQKVTMATWSATDVEKKVREVFTEVPDMAVAIARCTSFLDPLWVLPNTNGSRNWGVFQISDARLRELDGTPLRAFDPAWNIEAAHKLWSVQHDFHDWPACQAALQR